MRRRPQKNIDIHNGFGEWVNFTLHFLDVYLRFDKQLYNILDLQGGYMDAKKSKLEEQFAEDALKNPYKQSDLFAGISIFVNGLTTPSAEELKRIMMTHGGIFHAYQRYFILVFACSDLI